MLPVEGREGKTLSGDIHDAQRVSQRRIETSPVTADRKRICEWRYARSRVSDKPVHPEVVCQVGGSRPRETRLIEGQVLHVDRIVIDAVTGAYDHLGAELPGGRDSRQPHEFVLPRPAR